MTNSNAYLFQPNPGRSAAQDGYLALMKGAQGGLWPVLSQEGPPPCESEGEMSHVRFLSAAPGLPLLNVAVGGQVVSSGLGYQGLTDYQAVEGGFWPLTVLSTESPRTVYFKQSLPFVPGETVTYVLIHNRGRLDLVRVPDALCLAGQNGTSCLRVANFCYRSGPLELITEEGSLVFTGVLFKEVTAFRPIQPGDYLFYIGNSGCRPVPLPHGVESLSDTPAAVSDDYLPGLGETDPLVAFSLAVNPAAAYTVFVLGSASGSMVLVAEDPAQPI